MTEKKENSPSLTKENAIEALQRSEEKYKRIFNRILDVYLETNIDGQIIETSPSIERCLGYTSEEIVGKSILDYYAYPEKRDELLEKITTKNFIDDYEIILRHKDGQLIDCSVSAELERDHQGTPVKIQGVLRNITDRKKAERALAESEQMLKLMIDQIPYVIEFYKPDGMNFMVNSQWEELYQTSKRAINGKYNVLEDQQLKNSGLLPHIEKAFGGELSVIPDIEYDPAKSNNPGRKRWLRSKAIPIKDDAGELRFVVIMHEDISNIKQIEDELKESEEKFRLFFDQIPYILELFTPDGLTLMVNKQWEESYQTDKSQAIGKFNLLEDQQIKELGILPFLKKAFKGEKVVMPDSEFDPVKSDYPGRKRWLRTKVIPIKDTREEVKFVAIMHEDITEQKNAEDALHKSEEQLRQHVRKLEILKKIDQIIRSGTNAEEVMGQVMESVLEIFDCDRAWLLYPCDPEASSWQVPIERTKREYPGALDKNIELAMTDDAARAMREILETNQPLYGTLQPGEPDYDPDDQLAIRAYLVMAIYPKVGKPWEFGLHQCSYARAWQEEEINLFRQIGGRVSDALSILLILQNLRESEAFLNSIFENIPNMIFVKDARDLRFVRLNQAGEELLGYSRDELLGKNDYDFFPKNEADFFTEKDKDVLQSKQLLDIPEETVQTKNQGQRILHTKKIPILDSQGIPKYLLGISEDVTEQKRAAEELQQERALLRTLIDHLPNYIYVKDLESRFLIANATLATLMNASSADQLLGKTDADFYPPELAQTFRMDELEILETGKALIDKDEPFTKADGTFFHILTTKVPLKNARGEVIGLVGVGIDITARVEMEQALRQRTAELIDTNTQLQQEIAERKRAEEELKKHRDHLEDLIAERTVELASINEELEAFSYSVSHDLRTPLRHINGYLDALQESAAELLDAESQQYMGKITEAALKMNSLIDGLLALSRLGLQQLSKGQVALNTLVQDLIQEHTPEINERKIDWQIAALPNVSGDAIMLRVAFSNLISNALKYTRPRQPANIEIGTLPSSKAEDIIFIRDNGVGFDMAGADKLFGVFQRLHRADEFEGTGIGLATVQRIIHRHGGRIWAEAAVDQGATFYFTLPREGIS